MQKTINDYISELENYIKVAHETGDKYAFQDPAYDIRDELEELENPFEAVEPIFRLIERSPDIDFGGPGPLGAFLERFYKKDPPMNLEESLIESLQRKPTMQTVYMLSRLCNDKNHPDRPRFVKLLKTFADCDFLDDFWKKSIEEEE
jgi:hypothetical protein